MLVIYISNDTLCLEPGVCPRFFKYNFPPCVLGRRGGGHSAVWESKGGEPPNNSWARGGITQEKVMQGVLSDEVKNR